MTGTAEVRARAKALQEQKATLQARLAAGDRSARLELARTEEDLAACMRRFQREGKQRQPFRGRTISMDTALIQPWEEPDQWEQLCARDRMRLALQLARTALTPAQRDYLSQIEQGDRPGQVARAYGRDKSTISKMLRQGQRRLIQDAEDCYTLLARQDGGPMKIDLADPQVLRVVLSRLSTQQQVYLYLRYGQWYNPPQIGTLLGVDRSTVSREVKAGLRRLAWMCPGDTVEVRGLDSLEERLLACLDYLPPGGTCCPLEIGRGTGRRSSSEGPKTLRFVRGNQARTVLLRGGDRTPAGPPWGNSQLMGWLEEKRERQQAQMLSLRQWLFQLFAWMARELEVTHE